ncbi:MAG: T9SS type A sorting domain-containing protein [Bacteroidota bacterium]
MRKLLTLLAFWGMAMGAMGQRDGFWVMGNNFYPNVDFAIDFRSGTPDTVAIQKNMQTFLNFAQICDTNGAVLFYTDGRFIANAKGDSMKNGVMVQSTMGNNNAIFQGALILPYSYKTSNYHVFYETVNYVGNCNGGSDVEPFGIYHITIDMDKDNGYGEVIDSQHSKVIEDTIIAGKLSACKHANGKDWWVITHQSLNNTWVKLLMKDDTLFEKSYQAIGYIPDCGWDFNGQSVFNTDGKYFAVSGVDPNNKVFLLNFDRCNGDLSIAKIIQFPLPFNASQGVSFSPNSKYLYIGTYGSNLWQYDILQDTLRLVGHVDNSRWDNMYLQQLAPDGKIYICPSNSFKFLHVISYPNMEGLACGFDSAGFVLPSYNLTIPTFPNFNLGKLVGSPCDTLTVLNETAPATKEKEIKVFPNPAAEYVTVDYGFTDWSKGDVDLEITNGLGQAMHKQQLPRYSGFQKIEVSDLTSGVYVVNIKRKGQVVGAAKFGKNP